MQKALRSFQIFAKPVGPRCNLNCVYCYYIGKADGYPGGRIHSNAIGDSRKLHPPAYPASPDALIRFSWHGGEPTLLGPDYFRNIVDLQRRYRPPNKQIINGIQTNGTLIDDSWCDFLAEEHFSVGISLDGPAALHDPLRITKQHKPSHADALRGYHLLRKHGIVPDILCVVSAMNVERPLEVYGFFKQIEAGYIGFLPSAT